MEQSSLEWGQASQSLGCNDVRLLAALFAWKARASAIPLHAWSWYPILSGVHCSFRQADWWQISCGSVQALPEGGMQRKSWKKPTPCSWGKGWPAAVLGKPVPHQEVSQTRLFCLHFPPAKKKKGYLVKENFRKAFEKIRQTVFLLPKCPCLNIKFFK